MDIVAIPVEDVEELTLESLGLEPVKQVVILPPGQETLRKKGTNDKKFMRHMLIALVAFSRDKFNLQLSGAMLSGDITFEQLELVVGAGCKVC